MEALDNILVGFQLALSIEGLLYCLLGVALGTFIGALPGIGVMGTVAILLPITFHIEPLLALIMLSGIYYGAAYGGSIASILLNLPGTANTAITCLDGYPMAQQGRAGVALFITAAGSFVGAIIGLMLLVVTAPLLARVAANFGSPEYFALVVLGLICSTLLASGTRAKASISVSIGLLLGLVGTDVNSGQQRFTFGFPELTSGLPLVAICLGVFGLPEVIANSGLKQAATAQVKVTLRTMIPTRDDIRRSALPILRGTGIGAFFGTLPGVGSMIATFVAYVVEKRVHPMPEIFGKGAIEGIAAPESANNAATMTSFIPTLTLGIPGDAIMAMFLGALLVHGIAPGPRLITDHPELFWGLAASFLIGNILLLLLNIPLIGVWVRILLIPRSVLYPSIAVFICLGVYSVNYAVLDVLLVAGFGVLGYVMFLVRIEPAPLILALILGPIMEENFRRAMIVSNGSLSAFTGRPVALAIMIINIAIIALLVLRHICARRKLAQLGDER